MNKAPFAASSISTLHPNIQVPTLECVQMTSDGVQNSLHHSEFIMYLLVYSTFNITTLNSSFQTLLPVQMAPSTPPSQPHFTTSDWFFKSQGPLCPANNPLPSLADCCRRCSSLQTGSEPLTREREPLRNGVQRTSGSKSRKYSKILAADFWMNCPARKKESGGKYDLTRSYMLEES